MKKGIVLYIGGFEFPDKNAAAHRVLNNAKILKYKGKEVILIGINKNKNFVVKEYIQDFLTFSVPYPKNKKEWLKYLININEYIDIIKSLKNVETIILYNFQSIAMLKFMKYCKQNNIKLIADVTEWRSANGENLLYRIIKNYDTWFRMCILHKKMDQLIVISRYLFKYYKNHKNVIYIPPLSDMLDEKWINQYKKSTDILYLVYAGNPGLKDNINILIESLTNVNRKYHLDIIGIDINQYLKNFPSHRAFLINNKKIEFHGRLSHTETLDYVKKANYSCFFRKNNRVSNAGFPTKFVEALSCNTPVLTNKSSDLEDYIKNGKNGFFIDVFTSQCITECIERIPNIVDVETNLFDYTGYLNIKIEGDEE